FGGCKSVFSSNTDNFDFTPDSIGNADFKKGNTLHVKALGLTATNIHNFENYKFTLPNTVKNGDIALQLTDTAGTDLGADPKVDVVIEAGAPLVIEGGRADLIRNNNGLEYSGKLVLAPEADSTPPAEGDIPAEGDTPVAAVTARQGVSLEYDLVVGTDAESLYVTVTVPQPEEPVQPEEPTQPEEPGQPEAPAPVPPVQPAVRVNPQTKSLLEGRIATLAFVNQGADLIAGRGIAAAREASLEGELVPFMIGEAGKSRYQTGSHVDVRGFSMIAGLTYGKKTEIGDATLAAFFEGGWGNYESHNSFHNAASVRGDGNNKYYGGGMLAHIAFPELGPGNVYAEASFRAGWADSDYASGDLRDAFGNQAAYTSGAAYWGAHVGLGYEWKLSDSSLLDFYAKYFWTHHTGDSVSVVGDPIDFGASNSHRSRFGARYTKEIVSDGMVFKPFVGAAYEYEFNGKASGTTYGFAMDEPALRGGTGMGEVGMTFKPAEDSDFELDLSLQGYTGTREGVAGTFTLKYKF
ncbi:MAG: autotransporter outer membrane beta-barrel domain-containing protein, partial [Mailhella sp.]|nr:autotransporter outer membrane beta-barrel domain-containing protein [Mailhella sp.]